MKKSIMEKLLARNVYGGKINFYKFVLEDTSKVLHKFSKRINNKGLSTIRVMPYNFKNFAPSAASNIFSFSSINFLGSGCDNNVYCSRKTSSYAHFCSLTLSKSYHNERITDKRFSSGIYGKIIGGLIVASGVLLCGNSLKNAYNKKLLNEDVFEKEEESYGNLKEIFANLMNKIKFLEIGSRGNVSLCEGIANEGISQDKGKSESSCSNPIYQQTHPMWRSEAKRPFERKMDDALIFSGNSNIPLAQAVAGSLGTRLGRVQLSRFADGEVSMQFLDSLRGKDIYIIQPTSPPVNENLIELLLMISTCRRSSAKKITAVIPYYGYARQDRKLSSRVPISAADVARMIEAMGVDRVVAVDLHCGQIQGFFGPRVPVDNLEAQIVGLDHFTKMHLHKPVIVSPDAGGVYRARKFQEGLIARGVEDCNIAMLIKQRARANEIERMDLVGNVEDRDVIIVDDMIDTAGTLCEAASELKMHKARRVYAFATHGLFSGPALQRINKSLIEEVVVTDTISSVRENGKKTKKITTLSIAVLLADAIRRIHQKESLNDLFHIRNRKEVNAG